jgi:mono/diheme cytochrome c family protein
MNTMQTEHLEKKISLAGFTFLFSLVLLVTMAYSAGNATAGKTLFTTLCVSCHGADGNPPAAMAALKVPVFAKGERFEKPNLELGKTIKNGAPAVNGVPSAMVPNPTLTDQQIDDVLAFIRTLKK